MDKRYLTVSALNNYIKSKLDCDNNLQSILIKGEISNLKRSASGHIYLTLKDEKSSISCVIWKSNASKINFNLDNGQKVHINGYVSVYPNTGVYQLYINTIEPEGLGDLYLKFEALKKKLSKEGLFDEFHKKEIPSYPGKIAVLTAYPSAAASDILRTISNRYPVARVVIFKIPVQGNDAYKQIVKTIREVDTYHFSTMIISRGGGSLEDLWNFNEEEVARAIYECKTPVISGVGHEIDFTITDFVADYRAATPTAAAVKATPDMTQMSIDINQVEIRLKKSISNILHTNKQKLLKIEDFYLFKNPRKLYQDELSTLDLNYQKLQLYFKGFLQERSNSYKELNNSLMNKTDMFIKFEKNKISSLNNQLRRNENIKFNNEGKNFANIIARLNTLSPMKTLERGYSVVFKDKKVISSKDDLVSGDEISLKFKDGNKKAVVK
ncbi:MAG: exodeoxyribonuclease VII large subunit [Thomasclavelia sp.]|nr:exodeoxyribonuclease VII large subunit [Thomasclavelia sp.]